MAWKMELECGGLTSAGPALAVFNDRLYRAWKGMPDDNRMFFSSFDGTRWSPELECGGLTSAGPALAVFNDRLYRAWKGMPGDNRMFSSRFDGAHWSQEHSGMGLTSDGPSLAAMRNALFAAWKGRLDDNRMFFASYPGSPSIELRAIADPGDLIEVIGTGFTHDGAVRVVAILEDTLGAKTNTDEQAKSRSDGTFKFRIPVTFDLHSASVGAEDLDSHETATRELEAH